jgi:glycosyltransferase involved in cell wall biosynthesis
MRVLHVSWPTTEGVAVVLASYVRDQVARRWDVAVACPSGGWLATTAQDAGARVLPWAATRSPGPATLGETRRLATLVDELAPDLVHLHSSKAGLAGRLAVRGRIPTVFQPHAWSFHAVTGPMRRATVVWERTAVRWTAGFVYVSRAEQDEAARVGIRGRGWVIPNGVDLSRLTPADDTARADARERLGLPPGPLAVCVGRLYTQKGQHDLLDVWPAVRRIVPDASLVLVGGGPDEDALAVRAVAGVRLVGDRPDVSDWLAAANVVVAPSRWEGMALAPIEAMARARYVIATDVAGMREALPPDASTMVPVRAPAALAAALADRLADPEGTDAAGRVARRHVEREHDGAAAAAEVVRAYEALIQDR